MKGRLKSRMIRTLRSVMELFVLISESVSSAYQTGDRTKVGCGMSPAKLSRGGFLLTDFMTGWLKGTVGDKSLSVCFQVFSPQPLKSPQTKSCPGLCPGCGLRWADTPKLAFRLTGKAGALFADARTLIWCMMRSGQ